MMAKMAQRGSIALGIIAGLVVLALAFGKGTSDSRNREIAAGLVELHHQWETNKNIPSFFQSLTNLPFHDGAVGVGKGWVDRRHGILGLKGEERYFIYQPSPVTNSSEWTLYHAWFWYRPGGGRSTLAMRKLLTITTE